MGTFDFWDVLVVERPREGRDSDGFKGAGGWRMGVGGGGDDLISVIVTAA